jgi:hypothetical protein
MALLSACTSPVDSPPGNDHEPTITPGETTTWQAAPGWTIGGLATASSGDEGAIAYAESSAEDDDGVVKTILRLQRLDAAGAARGPAIELGTVSAGYRPTLSLTTDGARYLACWQMQSQIDCATVPVSGGPASPALSVVGANPSLAFGGGTWALAYGFPGHLAVQRVASDGTASGAVALFATGGDANPSAFLAGTKLGFVLAGAADTNSANSGDVSVHWLSSALAPIADPVDLGVKFWFRGAIAASETSVAVSVSKPYGGTIFLLDPLGGAVTSSHDLSGGGKVGINLALAADGASFEVLSADDEAGINYTSIAGEEMIASEGALEADRSRYDDGTIALLRIHGELFVAATPGYQGAELIVTRAHRP